MNVIDITPKVPTAHLDRFLPKAKEVTDIWRPDLAAIRVIWENQQDIRTLLEMETELEAMAVRLKHHHDAYRELRNEALLVAVRREVLISRIPPERGKRRKQIGPSQPIEKTDRQDANDANGTGVRKQLAKAAKNEAKAWAVVKASNESGETLSATALARKVTASSTDEDYDGDEYGTPEEWLEMARTGMGSIELDVASNDRAQQLVKAKRWFCKKHSALDQRWTSKTLWFQPPYSITGAFVEHLELELDAKRAKLCTALVNNQTDATWWHALMRRSSLVLFPEGRIKFLGPDNRPVSGTRQGQSVHLIGGNGNDRKRWRKAFANRGIILEGTW